MTPQGLLAVCTGLLLLKIFISFVSRYRRHQILIRQHGCLPPPKAKLKDPIFGIDVILSNGRAAREHRSLQTFEERFYSIGATYSTKHGFPLIITMEPENVRAVINQNFHDYALAPFRQPALKHFLGDGIFTTDGEKWHSSRALLRPNFNRDQIANLEAIETHVQDLFALLPRDGTTPVDLKGLLLRFTMDSTTEFLFGQSVYSLRRNGTGDGDSLEAQFETAFTGAQAECMEFIGMGPLARFARVKSQKQVEIVHRYIDKFVDRAIAFRKEYEAGGGGPIGTDKEKPKYLFLQELAKQTTDRTRLRSELLNILMAGRDTTASLLGNLFFMISKSPEIMAKLQQEVDSLNGARPSYSSLRDMKYLKYCLRECEWLLMVWTESASDLDLLDGASKADFWQSRHSPTAPPRRSRQYTHRRDRHRSATWWWTRRKQACARTQGHCGRMVRVRHAPAQGSLRSRRRPVSPRTLGDPEHQI